MSLRLPPGLLSAASALALGLASPVAAQDAQTIQRAATIRDAALKENVALDYVTRLTTRFGPRPAGSRSEQEAAAWAADYLKAWASATSGSRAFP